MAVWEALAVEAHGLRSVHCRGREHAGPSGASAGAAFARSSRCDPSVDAPFVARENFRIVVARSRMLPSVRPHMRAFLSSLFHRSLLHVYWSRLRISRQSKAELSLRQVFPANLTSGGTMSPPRSRIRDGRAPGGWHHSVRRRLSCQAGQRRHPLGSVRPCQSTARGSTSDVDQHPGFMTAPSGTTP